MNLKTLAGSVNEITRNLQLSVRGFLAKYGEGCRNRGALNCRDAPHELGHLKIPKEISVERNDGDASLATQPLNVVSVGDTSSKPTRHPGKSAKPSTSVPP